MIQNCLWNRRLNFACYFSKVYLLIRCVQIQKLNQSPDVFCSRRKTKRVIICLDCSRLKTKQYRQQFYSHVQYSYLLCGSTDWYPQGPSSLDSMPIWVTGAQNAAWSMYWSGHHCHLHNMKLLSTTFSRTYKVVCRSLHNFILHRRSLRAAPHIYAIIPGIKCYNCEETSIALFLTVDITLLRYPGLSLMEKIHIRVDSILHCLSLLNITPKLDSFDEWLLEIEAVLGRQDSLRQLLSTSSYLLLMYFLNFLGPKNQGWNHLKIMSRPLSPNINI